MTVEIYDGPGVEDYRSSLYTATVNGNAVYVYGVAETATTDTEVWNPTDSVEISWFTFGTNETVTVVVEGDTTPITSAIVYPKKLAYTYTVAGGALTLTLPVGAKVFIVINDDWKNTLCIFADALKPAIPGGYITYNGTQTKVTTGTCLYFPAGVHNIGQLFEVESNSTLYMDGGAWLKGNLDIRGNVGCVITGPGVLSGEDFDPTAIRLLSWGSAIEYSAILGYDTTPGADNSNFADNYVRRITAVDQGYYGLAWGTNYAHGVKMIAPWHPNSDGIRVSKDVSASSTCEIHDCFVFVGDDAITMVDNDHACDVDNNVVIGASSATLNFGYFGWGDGDAETSITDTYTVRISETENGGYEYSHVIKCFSDQDNDPAEPGRFNVTIDGLYIEGEYCEHSSLFHLANFAYQWGTPALQQGEVAEWSISNVTMEYAPLQVSTLYGKDRKNTPHDIAFDNIVIEGVKLTHRNFTSYVDTNEGNFLYNITINGVTMVTAVDICNTALSYLGDEGRVASISPLDGTTQSKLCARFYPMARDAVLEAHEWGFATKRIELTEVTTDATTEWDYCYEIPADMLRALAIQPDESTADYVVPTTAAYPLVGSGSKVTQEYAIELDADDTLRIFTDQEDAWLRYTAYVTNPGVFSPLFVQAVAWKLAAMLAGPLLKGDAGAAEAKRCEQVALTYLSKASVSDAKQRQSHPTQVVPWISGR